MAAQQNDLNSVYFLALTGQTQELQKLLVTNENLSSENKKSIKTKDKWGMSALQYAIRNGHVETAIVLINYGASLLDPGPPGKTTLEYAWNLNPKLTEYLYLVEMELIKNMATIKPSLPKAQPDSPLFTSSRKTNTLSSQYQQANNSDSDDEFLATPHLLRRHSI